MTAKQDQFTPEAIADRLERVADRYDNAGDVKGAQDARAAAATARGSSPEAARAVEVAFNLGHEIDTQIPETGATGTQDAVAAPAPVDAPPAEESETEPDLGPAGVDAEDDSGADAADDGGIDVMEAESGFDLDDDGDIGGVPIGELIGDEPGGQDLPSDLTDAINPAEPAGESGAAGTDAERDPASEGADGDDADALNDILGGDDVDTDAFGDDDS